MVIVSSRVSFFKKSKNENCDKIYKRTLECTHARAHTHTKKRKCTIKMTIVSVIIPFILHTSEFEFVENKSQPEILTPKKILSAEACLLIAKHFLSHKANIQCTT